MCVQTPRVCFSVCSLDVCSTSVHVCEWERCAQSNYVIRAEPSGHLCGRALQLAKDSLLDFVSLLFCVCVCVYNWTPYGWELPFPCISLCIALMQHLLQLEETCDWRKLYIKVVFIQIKQCETLRSEHGNPCLIVHNDRPLNQLMVPLIHLYSLNW